MPVGHASSSSVRPNILLFLTDDHGPWSLGCYGNHEAQTPQLDRLAREGARFAQALSPCPVCSPARACLMTGRTPSQVGVHDWLDESISEIAQRQWLAGEIVLPQILAAGGYHTMLSGKWHMGDGTPNPPGYRRCFGLRGWQGVHNGPYTYHLDGAPMPLAGNKTRILTDWAIKLLDEAPADQPFFLNVGYIATHSPYESETQDPAMVAKFADCEFKDIPPYHPHPWCKNEGFPGGNTPSREQILSRYRGYYAAVAEIDTGVGRIVDHLRATGRLGNTIVIYVSDHGCALGHQGYWGKGNSTRPLNMYESSLRVPLIVRGPGIAAGQSVSQAVDHYDLFQAVVQWAGLAAPAGRAYPGRSLVPLAAGENCPDWNDTHYGEYGDLRMIRTRDYKFVKRYPHGPYDLFDLREDPKETLNVAGWDRYLPIQHELEQQLETWYARYEDPARSGLRVKELPRHNNGQEAWRDGRREARGLQVY